MLFQLDGSGGRSRSFAGTWLSSGAVSPMTIFISGTLYSGSGPNRLELSHIRPSVISMTLVR